MIWVLSAVLVFFGLGLVLFCLCQVAAKADRETTLTSKQLSGGARRESTADMLERLDHKPEDFNEHEEEAPE